MGSRGAGGISLGSEILDFTGSTRFEQGDSLAAGESTGRLLLTGPSDAVVGMTELLLFVFSFASNTGALSAVGDVIPLLLGGVLTAAPIVGDMDSTLPLGTTRNFRSPINTKPWGLGDRILSLVVLVGELFGFIFSVELGGNHVVTEPTILLLGSTILCESGGFA